MGALYETCNAICAVNAPEIAITQIYLQFLRIAGSHRLQISNSDRTCYSLCVSVGGLIELELRKRSGCLGDTRDGNTGRVYHRIRRRQRCYQKSTQLLIEFTHSRRTKCRRGRWRWGTRFFLVLLECTAGTSENALSRGTEHRLSRADRRPANAQDLATIEVEAIDFVVCNHSNKIASQSRAFARSGTSRGRRRLRERRVTLR
jgi:hypothetical protein